jgi:hypothetical protein
LLYQFVLVFGNSNEADNVRRLCLGIIGCLAMGLVTSACGNVGNMFSGGGPERPFDDRVGPDTEALLKNRPKGLIADTANAKHGSSDQAAPADPF